MGEAAANADYIIITNDNPRSEDPVEISKNILKGIPLNKNTEVILDRKLSDKRTYPAIGVQKSGTRKEDLLLDAGDLQKVFILRKILSSMGTVDAMEFLLDKMKDCKTNEEFFSSMNQ